MADILLKALPFFALVALGWGAGRSRFFPEEGTVWLTRFVFCFALSAMPLRFGATLSLREILDPALSRPISAAAR